MTKTGNATRRGGFWLRWGGLAAMAATRGAVAKAYDTGASDSEDQAWIDGGPYKRGRPRPYGAYGQCQTGVLQDDQRAGWHQRARKVTLHLARQRVQARPRAPGSDAPASSRATRWLAIAGFLGNRGPNTSVQKYLNEPQRLPKPVPDGRGAERFKRSQATFPWIVPLYYIIRPMSGQGEIFAQFIPEQAWRRARSACSYVNDDLGKDFPQRA